MKRKPIDVEELKKVFRINDKGKLERLYYGKWKEIPVVSNHTHEYCRVRFLDKIIRYHVVLWILYTGKDVPADMVVDHINGNKLDNRIENLRMITQRENTQNTKQHRSGKLCGYVYDNHTKKYKAQISIRRVKIYLGYYETPEIANSVYLLAVRYKDRFTDKESFREFINSKM